eukprot:TRINITY_DN6516_c0_g1_i1.p1 TRINITY_DN6516_c0_g1~~TRINITY_DN6516_c0_g1_i1.p1  ORF type:complete len:248 (+),score=25.50 TRINITY_DN6516_c0_g1_i1:257-1000(+)
MLGWSLVQTVITDPGKVPLYWGFFLDDPEHKKRRYCLICHIFKPERCHHCSACNRCVLNMDHHCPWINNCVGFYNRKFFVLLLFYTVTSLFLSIIGMLPTVVHLIGQIARQNDFSIPRCIVVFFVFLFTTVLCTVLSMFFRFHVKMIFDNITTIENLERKRMNNTAKSSYDMGPYYNFIQVFGKDKWLWLFPIFLETGKPIGDGVVWPVRQAQVEAQEYENLPSPIKSDEKEGATNWAQFAQRTHNH